MKQEYNPLPKETILAIKEGDVIERMLAFCIPMFLKVNKVTEDRIWAGDEIVGEGQGWTFDRNTGLEIDEEISHTVSYIRRVLTEEEKLQKQKLK